MNRWMKWSRHDCGPRSLHDPLACAIGTNAISIEKAMADPSLLVLRLGKGVKRGSFPLKHDQCLIVITPSALKRPQPSYQGPSQCFR